MNRPETDRPRSIWIKTCFLLVAVLLLGTVPGCASRPDKVVAKVPVPPESAKPFPPMIAEHALFPDPDSSTQFSANLNPVPLAIPRQNSYLETLRTELFIHENPRNTFWAREYAMFADFYFRGVEEQIEIHPGRDKLIVKTWIRTPESPLVVILPGLGSPYTSGTITALAERLYLHGYSVISFSNAMNWQFMLSGASVLAPGYTPQDARDIYFSLVKVLAFFHEKRNFHPTRKILLGYSLGGLHTLFVASIDPPDGLIGFDRFVAINPPVDLAYGLHLLDEMFGTWRKWEQEPLQVEKDKPKLTGRDALLARVDRAAGTYFALVNGKIPVDQPIPMSEEDAKFLIGFSFHMILGETIYCIHRKENLNVVRQPVKWFARSGLYEEIGHYTFEEYFSRFIRPYYHELWQKVMSREEMGRRSGLKAVETNLKTDSRIRILHNTNDFLLRPEDVVWLRDTLGERLILFDRGGHLGNLYDWFAQQYLINAIDGTNSGQ